MTSPKIKVYVIRHGQTDENSKGILCGQQIDNSLNHEGIRQAHEVADKLKHMGFKALYSSDMKRTMQTAEVVAEVCGGKKIIRDKRLRERDYGSLAGKTWEGNFGDKASEMHRKDTDQKFDYTQYGGESAKQVLVRVLDFLADVGDKGQSPVVVVTHGGVLKSLKKHFDGEPYYRTPSNGDILEIEI